MKLHTRRRGTEREEHELIAAALEQLDARELLIVYTQHDTATKTAHVGVMGFLPDEVDAVSLLRAAADAVEAQLARERH